jgi:hypothetical protein
MFGGKVDDLHQTAGATGSHALLDERRGRVDRIEYVTNVVENAGRDLGHPDTARDRDHFLVEHLGLAGCSLAFALAAIELECHRVEVVAQVAKLTRCIDVERLRVGAVCYDSRKTHHRRDRRHE